MRDRFTLWAARSAGVRENGRQAARAADARGAGGLGDEVAA